MVDLLCFEAFVGVAFEYWVVFETCSAFITIKSARVKLAPSWSYETKGSCTQDAHLVYVNIKPYLASGNFSPSPKCHGSCHLACADESPSKYSCVVLCCVWRELSSLEAGDQMKEVQDVILDAYHIQPDPNKVTRKI